VKRKIFPFVFFLLSIVLSIERSLDPFLFEEDLGEGFVVLRIEGEHRLEENKLIAKAKVLGGDFPEIYNKRAL
jgi:hypothetical protein